MQQQFQVELEISDEEPTTEQRVALDKFWNSVIDRIILRLDEEERLAALRGRSFVLNLPHGG